MPFVAAVTARPVSAVGAVLAVAHITLPLIVLSPSVVYGVTLKR